MIEEYRVEEEHLALRRLLHIAETQLLYRIDDEDQNGVREYWTGDIGGLWPNAKHPYFLEIKKADTAPLRARGTVRWRYFPVSSSAIARPIASPMSM